MDGEERFPDRRSIRLKHFDYSQAATYFVTLCTVDRQYLFGEIADGVMQLNVFGRIVEEEWLKSEAIRPTLHLDEFVVMPNHFHGLVAYCEGDGDESRAQSRAHCCEPLPDSEHEPLIHARTFGGREVRSLSSFIACFKAITTKYINILRNTPGAKIWQRGLFERVIRSEEKLYVARQYVIDNPARWSQDINNPMRVLSNPS